MGRVVVAAIDIGASGGRVIAGIIDGDRVELDEVHRFANAVVERDGHLRWNIHGLFEQVLDGLALLATAHPDVASVGIDTWAVDYALLDADGRLLADPISYRDARTTAVVDDVHARISPPDLYAINGLQFLPFTTIYQLAAEPSDARRAAHAVLLPDLLAYWLTGELRTEYTNATTTGLVDVHTRTWSTDLFDRLGLRRDLFPPIVQPGTPRGRVLPTIAARTGLPATTPITTVCSHDTASAVVGVPMLSDSCAYVASGTWSLVGLEVGYPVIDAAAHPANFTNEGGVDGTYRFLRNVGGLWLLQECLRTWQQAGTDHDLETLLATAALEPADAALFDVDDDTFIAPGNMPQRITDAITAAGTPAPTTPAGITRAIVDSLAHGYARTIAHAATIAERSVDTVHIVGGGSRNALLCQRTADICGLPVVAGPVEATALGNVLVQARALGAAPTTIAGLRQLVAASTELHRYEP